MEQDSIVLSVDNLEVCYDSVAILKNISFSVSKGEILGIIGQNGSGKSTLFKGICSVVEKRNGTVIFNNMNITKMGTERIISKGIAYFTQSGLILPTLTGLEHFKLLNATVEKLDFIYTNFPFFATKLKIHLNKKAKNLSGGQKQLLSLMMMLLQDASLWLLDEPTSGLSDTQELLDNLNIIRSKGAITIIIIEHNYEFIFRIADKIMVIKNNSNTEKYDKTAFLKENFLSEYLYD